VLPQPVQKQAGVEKGGDDLGDAVVPLVGAGMAHRARAGIVEGSSSGTGSTVWK